MNKYVRNKKNTNLNFHYQNSTDSMTLVLGVRFIQTPKRIWQSPWGIFYICILKEQSLHSHLIDRYMWRTKKSEALKPTAPSIRKKPKHTQAM